MRLTLGLESGVRVVLGGARCAFGLGLGGVSDLTGLGLGLRVWGVLGVEGARGMLRLASGGVLRVEGGSGMLVVLLGLRGVLEDSGRRVLGLALGLRARGIFESDRVSVVVGMGRLRVGGVLVLVLGLRGVLGDSGRGVLVLARLGLRARRVFEGGRVSVVVGMGSRVGGVLTGDRVRGVSTEYLGGRTSFFL